MRNTTTLSIEPSNIFAVKARQCSAFSENCDGGLPITSDSGSISDADTDTSTKISEPSIGDPTILSTTSTDSSTSATSPKLTSVGDPGHTPNLGSSEPPSSKLPANTVGQLNGTRSPISHLTDPVSSDVSPTDSSHVQSFSNTETKLDQTTFPPAASVNNTVTTQPVFPTPTTTGKTTNSHISHVGAIAGGIIGGIGLIIIMTLLLFWRKKKMATKKEIKNAKPFPFDLKHDSIHADILVPTPKSLKQSVSQEKDSPNSVIPSNPVSSMVQLVGSENRPPTTTFSASHPVNNTHSRVLSESSVTHRGVPFMTSNHSQSTRLTDRQLHIRSEADDLRIQLQSIQETQQAMVSSNDHVKSTLAMVIAHIQRLDRQFDSDWARGLTDEAPPDYDSRRG
ncbi:hypothetical protein VKT23_010131 [Stygiomarasmius scandens]|uniref:Mid2 domain-containing protein n=1 Tax=Marasmiellus scandens TaxID=2682957 RepID=A0ABR1JGV2_9AGAR